MTPDGPDAFLDIQLDDVQVAGCAVDDIDGPVPQTDWNDPSAENLDPPESDFAVDHVEGPYPRTDWSDPSATENLDVLARHQSAMTSVVFIRATVVRGADRRSPQRLSAAHDADAGSSGG